MKHVLFPAGTSPLFHCDDQTSGVLLSGAKLMFALDGQ